MAAGSGAKSVVPLADSLTRTWARLGVEESLAHRQWPHVIEVDEQDALDKAIGVEQSLPHKQWHDSIEADEQEALDEAFVAAARRSMAEYIAELSAERAIGGVASQKGSSTAPQPNSRQNGSDRPTLDEVLDRIGTRHGGEIGFEEAVNIIESERNNR